MEAETMRLKILLPSRIFLESTEILKILVETKRGAMGILPHRLDFVASLVPGLFSFWRGPEPTVLAVDEGIILKIGSEVLVSVWHAMEGKGEGSLKGAVENSFEQVREQERDVRASLAKLESGFLRRLTEIWGHG